MTGKKNIEAAQQKQLILHYKQVWLPQYPDLRVTYTKNEGKKSKITAIEDLRMGLEPGHPDLKWRVRYAGHYYFLYHELKKLDGDLKPNQINWWAEFTPTEFVKGKITYGWEAHIAAVEEWLKNIFK